MWNKARNVAAALLGSAKTKISSLDLDIKLQLR